MAITGATLVAERERVTVTQAPSRQETEEIVGRIHEIGPLLRELAPQADRNRMLSDEAVQALESTGAWRISALKRYGGYEGGADMLLQCASAVGYYDPAAAWCVVISNGSVMLANRFSDAMLDEVFAEVNFETRFQLAWVGGELWVVSTRFSCLCTPHPDYSFVPRWRPPFITALAAEDRCHSTGWQWRTGKRAT